MTDALKPMSEAPIGSRFIAFWKDTGNATLCRRFRNDIVWTPDGNAASNLKDFLPLPADASSANVAKTAGEWLSVCSDEDVAAVIRDALKRDGVREAIVNQIDDGPPAEWPAKEWHESDRRTVAVGLDILAMDQTDD